MTLLIYLVFFYLNAVPERRRRLHFSVMRGRETPLETEGKNRRRLKALK